MIHSKARYKQHCYRYSVPSWLELQDPYNYSWVNFHRQLQRILPGKITSFNLSSMFLDCRKSMMQMKYSIGKWRVLTADMIGPLTVSVYALCTSIKGTYGHKKYRNTHGGALLIISVITAWNLANSHGCRHVCILRHLSPARAAKKDLSQYKYSMACMCPALQQYLKGSSPHEQRATNKCCRPVFFSVTFVKWVLTYSHHSNSMIVQSW